MKKKNKESMTPQLDEWPELKPYLRYISTIVSSNGYHIDLISSPPPRGGVGRIIEAE